MPPCMPALPTDPLLCAVPALHARQIGNVRGKPCVRRWGVLSQKRHCVVHKTKFF